MSGWLTELFGERAEPAPVEDRTGPSVESAARPVAKPEAKSVEEPNAKFSKKAEPVKSPEVISSKLFSSSVDPKNSGPVKLAIVIDDIGDGHPENSRAALNLPGSLTMAFLPYGNPKRLAGEMELGRHNGHELIMHTPMKPESNGFRLPENTLFPSDTRQQIENKIGANFDFFGSKAQYFSGFNNHMGSAFSQNIWGMRAAIGASMERDGSNMGYVLDSMTVPADKDSKICAAAAKMDVPCVERDIFLDHTIDSKGYVREQLEAAVRHAYAHGTAIAIGHPHPETVAVLQEMLPELINDPSIEIVPVSEIVEARNPDVNFDVSMRPL